MPRSDELHLENPNPGGRTSSPRCHRTPRFGVIDDGVTTNCDLWSGDPSTLGRAAASSLPYAPLCEGRLYLRNPVAGHRTDLERVAEFLRDHVWRGEEIVGFVRDQLLGDAYLERATPSPAGPQARPRVPQPGGGERCHADRAVATEHPASRSRAIWIDCGWDIGARNLPGITSVIQPQVISGDPLRAIRVVNRLTREAAALDYLVAFDLAAFDLGSRSHRPSAWGWSPRRPRRSARPACPADGIDSIRPLVTTAW
jgi:hypothetical protein